MINRCRSCNFFAPLELQCRVNPPVPVPKVNPQSGQVDVFGIFPPATADQFCGKWEPDINGKGGKE